jgi:acetyl esterase
MHPPTQLLTPAMSGVLERVRRANRPPLHALSPALARVAYEVGAEILDLPRAPLVRVENVELAGRPARLYAPSLERGLPALLYLHGGGFVVGSLETHDSLCRQLALRSGGAVVALDYRLAPEHRFPAAQDDAWAALRALRTDAGVLGLDGTRLAVGGDSAGGTLAAVCAIEARDAGLPLALQLLITPGTAADATFASRHLFANGFLLDSASIDWFYEHAIDTHHRRQWRFAPLEADDLAGVAPACLILAECDPLVDESIAYGDRLRAAGVTVALELERGVTHDFIKMGRALKVAGLAQQWAADALAAAWRHDR